MLAFSDKRPPPTAIRRNQMWDGNSTEKVTS